MNETMPTAKTETKPTGRLPRLEAPRPKKLRARFTIREFKNASGTVSFRVQGQMPGGRFIRENFADPRAAECRRLELDQQASATLASQPVCLPRMTDLTDAQLRLAEAAFSRLLKLEAQDSDLLDAVSFWVRHGRAKQALACPRLSEAAQAFRAWLKTTPDGNGGCTLRPSTRYTMGNHVRLFAAAVEDVRLDALTVDHLMNFLDGMVASSSTKKLAKACVSRFLSWAKDPPRRWVSHNVALDLPRQSKKMVDHVPDILSLDDAEKLLRTAEGFEAGRFVPLIVLSLFCGLRPSEAARLDWSQINLDDRRLRIEGHQSKIGKSRVIDLDDAAVAWLTAYRPSDATDRVAPRSLLLKMSELRKLSGLANRAPDLLRHTAISFHWQRTQSFGATALWAGNSEQIIRQHYQSRVSAADAAKFYALRPTGKAAA